MSIITERKLCGVCGHDYAVTGRLYKYDNGKTETVAVCAVCAIRYEASK